MEVKAEAAEIVSRQNAPVRAAQATHDHYAACVHRSLARSYRGQPAPQRQLETRWTSTGQLLSTGATCHFFIFKSAPLKVLTIPAISPSWVS